MKTKDILPLAKKMNLCSEWQSKMKENGSLEHLCQMYFEGDDWAMKNDFPALSVLRDFKGKSELFGLYTDYTGNIRNRLDVALFGNSKVILSYDGFSVGKIIARHNSRVKVIVSGNAMVFINLLDDAEVEIVNTGNNPVQVFCYDNHNVRGKGNIKVTTSTFDK